VRTSRLGGLTSSVSRLNEEVKLADRQLADLERSYGETIRDARLLERGADLIARMRRNQRLARDMRNVLTRFLPLEVPEEESPEE